MLYLQCTLLWLWQVLLSVHCQRDADNSAERLACGVLLPAGHFMREAVCTPLLPKASARQCSTVMAARNMGGSCVLDHVDTWSSSGSDPQLRAHKILLDGIRPVLETAIPLHGYPMAQSSNWCIMHDQRCLCSGTTVASAAPSADLKATEIAVECAVRAWPCCCWRFGRPHVVDDTDRLRLRLNLVTFTQCVSVRRHLC